MLHCKSDADVLDVEYSRSGSVIKGRERAKARSKYEEDVHVNNHLAIWGSFYDRETGRWGFACCHSISALLSRLDLANKQSRDPIVQAKQEGLPSPLRPSPRSSKQHHRGNPSRSQRLSQNNTLSHWRRVRPGLAIYLNTPSGRRMARTSSWTNRGSSERWTMSGRGRSWAMTKHGQRQRRARRT